MTLKSTTTKTGRPTKADLEKELENLKKTVVEEVWNTDGGCDSGKRDFLKRIGLAQPLDSACDYDITFTITLTEEDVQSLIDNWDSCLDESTNMTHFLADNSNINIQFADFDLDGSNITVEAVPKNV